MSTKKRGLGKFTRGAKENVAAVFNRLGGTAAMAEWARENQTEFYKLYARLIPVQHDGELRIREVVELSDAELIAIAAGGLANIAAEAGGADESGPVH